MATKIKKISELEQIAELSSSSNVIIEENGKAKRFAASNLDGKVKTVNGVEPDENGNIEVEVDGGVTSWNDLTDRPFYEEGNQTVIEWDGNTEGRDSVNIDSDVYYKISDFTPSKEDLSGCFATLSNGQSGVLPNEAIVELDSGLLQIAGSTLVISVAQLGEGEYTVVVPSTGIYAAILSDVFLSKLTYGSTTVHQLDEKFIPESIAHKTDVTWENLPDKPFGDSQTVIEWDGNTEGRDSFTLGSGIYYKTSDLIPSTSELNGGTVSMVIDGSETESELLNPDEYLLLGDNCYLVYDAVIVVEDTAITFSEMSAIAPSTGVYMLYASDSAYGNGLTYCSTKTIEQKYLPTVPVTSVNGMTGDVMIETGSGGVTSWNDLTDRPFYEEGTGVTIEWDGSTEGRESFAFGSNTIFYKVSDATPSVEMLSEAKVTASVGEETFDYPLADAMVTGDGWIVLGELGLVITKVPAGNLDGNPVTASSVGVYINSYVSSVSITYGSTTVHQLDEKFIPDSVKVQADFSQNDPTKPDYVRNRTHWEEDNQTIIEWDGNTEGRDNFIVSGPNLIFYKVSDNTPTSEEIIGGFFTITDSEGSPEDINIIEDDVISGDKCIFLSTYIAIAYDTQINVFGQDITLTTTGTYFLYLDRECVSKLTYGSTTVHQIDEKFIPESIARVADIPEVNYPVTSVNGMTGDVVIEGGSGGPSVQSDWNQNDENAADYVKNRPFYDKQEILISEQTLTFADMGIGLPMAVPSGMNVDTVTDYVVEFDGEKYTGTAVVEDNGAFSIGNSNLDFSSGDPFCIAYSTEQGWLAVASTTGDHTVTLRAMVTTKIPAKYMPKQEEPFFTTLGSMNLIENLKDTNIGDVVVYRLSNPEYLFDTTTGHCKYYFGISSGLMYLIGRNPKYAIFRVLTGLAQRTDGSVIECQYAYVYDDEGLANLKSYIGVSE